jgi:hypothetical protein
MKMYEDYLCEMELNQFGGYSGIAARGMSAYMIFQRAKGIMNSLFTKAGRQCSTIIDTREKNICMLRAKIKAMEVELVEISKSKRQCKDQECKTRIANRYLYLRNSVQAKKDQYNKLVGY